MAAAARVLEAVGERLAAGDTIITGSIAQAPIRRGDRIAATISLLGSVALAVEGDGYGGA
jgi:2-keto-4-pentenoate hydratase